VYCWHCPILRYCGLCFGVVSDGRSYGHDGLDGQSRRAIINFDFVAKLNTRIRFMPDVECEENKLFPQIYENVLIHANICPSADNSEHYALQFIIGTSCLISSLPDLLFLSNIFLRNRSLYCLYVEQRLSFNERSLQRP